MTSPLRRLARIRVVLALMVLLVALSWAICGGVVLLMMLRIVGIKAALPLAVVAGLSIFAVLLWRYRGLRSLQALALWVEEEEQDAAYALVTLADPNLPANTDLLAAADAVAIEGRADAAMHRLTVQVLTAFGIAGTLWFAIGRGLERRENAASAGAPAPDAPSRIASIEVKVTPPKYTGLSNATLRNPQSVEAVVGSQVEVTGSGSSTGINAKAGDSARIVSNSGSEWNVRFAMPAAPGVLSLTDRQFNRLVVLAPRMDSVPEVVLQSPAHDTTYRTIPTETIALDARARDDFGLASGYYEYLITVGGDENFTTTTRLGARQNLANARNGVLHGALRLDTLHLTPGSVVSVRAVVLDGNDLTGPGKGFSETRTLRIAERQDSTAITAAPPDQVDSMLISQRLLNMRTDSLIKARRSMAKKAFNDRSMTHSNTQESIRQRVLTVIGVIEDDGQGGTAPTDVSKLLRVAAEEMASARVELAISSPTTAMPHMKKALAILDQVRLANRYYLRGRQPAELVDIEKVRLKGEGTPTPASRSARPVLSDSLARLSARIEAAVALYRTAPEAARDSLTLIRVGALSIAPSLGRELGSALEALAHGVVIDSALAPVRRVLAPAPIRLTDPADWAGSTP